MDINNMKCVMIFSEDLPIGVIANTAAIMGASLGKSDPEIVGITPTDKDGREHSGLIQFPVPILKSDSTTIRDIRNKAIENYCDDISYLGLTLCGPKKAINKLTGSLSLLR